LDFKVKLFHQKLRRQQAEAIETLKNENIHNNRQREAQNRKHIRGFNLATVKYTNFQISELMLQQTLKKKRSDLLAVIAIQHKSEKKKSQACH
jgi:hypothetical protein